MKRGEFKSKNLKDWYEEINSFQCEWHGHDYNEMHRVIKEYLKEGDSYKEFGVMQGGTASCAMLQNPSSVELVDINFTRFAPYRPIFEEYCKENDIILKEYAMSSDSLGCLSDVDMLLIDSQHTSMHLQRELNTHATSVRKHIVCHDTNVVSNGMQKVLEKFVKNNSDWKMVEYYQSNVGFTHLSKVV